MIVQNRNQIFITSIIRGIFLFDAIGTGIFAFWLLFFADYTAELSGVDNTTIIRIIGIGSIFPASFSFWAASRTQLPKILVLLFTTLCLLWVIGSIVLMILVPFTMIGNIGISTVAFLVGMGGILLFYFSFIKKVDKNSRI